MTMLGMMVGNFEPAHFFESHTPALSVIMGTIYIMLMLVILFNLLIAILSDSFEKIKVRGNMRLIKSCAQAMDGGPSGGRAGDMVYSLRR